jgi:hypothetical protein
MDVIPFPPKASTAPKAKVVVGFSDRLQGARMVVQPLLMAIPALIIWHFFYKNGWHSTSEADEPIVNAILPGIFGAHVFLAGWLIFQGKGKDLREMKLAVRNKDKEGNKEKFLILAEDQIPIPLKYVLFTTATIIQCWTISFGYTNYWSGFAAVLSVAYVLSLIWEVIADFDDPFHGVWVIKGVPQDWMQEAKVKRRFSDRVFERLIK